MIAVSRRGDLVRIALLRGDDLAEYWLWNLAAPDGLGDIYTARVDAVMPALAGRFLALGNDLSGFLPDSAGGKNLTVGDYVAVRVTRAPQGDKGPRLEVVAEPHGDAPGLIRRGPGPLLDLAARFPAAEIVLDDYELMAQLRPTLAGRMRHDAKAFDTVLEDEVTALAEPTAPLPHGAAMHISPAKAATLIDIDAASASAINPLALNTAIIPEICRQIVLRNLSGGILIDFAGLKSAQRQKLAEPLRAALTADTLRPSLLGFSHLGFAEINRRRIRPPLHELLSP
ncbi:ribonuclease E/G [Acidocella aromatica]|uniref:Ribonuclease G/E n=1 Tax=Acidocella aromatica TaxID=1303579 RepID=A0A840VCI3_9PROT|nr:ribonuclease E/G [Acidocella aromatica]MBB5373523.1 Ribonuclease G/E [Acidocella aromatica]